MIYRQSAVWIVPVALIWILGLPAHAGVTVSPVNIEIANYTFSGGDPIFDVTDDLLFTNLTLTELFTNGTSNQTTTLTLLDPNGNQSSSLDVFSYLDSSSLLSPAIPDGYTLSSATLTGSFDTTNAATATYTVNGDGTLTVNTQTGFDPSTAGMATILPNFTATLNNPTPGQIVPIYALNSDGSASSHAIGTLDASPAPEPSQVSVLALVAGLIGIAAIKRRLKGNAR